MKYPCGHLVKCSYHYSLVSFDSSHDSTMLSLRPCILLKQWWGKSAAKIIQSCNEIFSNYTKLFFLQSYYHEILFWLRTKLRVYLTTDSHLFGTVFDDCSSSDCQIGDLHPQKLVLWTESGRERGDSCIFWCWSRTTTNSWWLEYYTHVSV